MAQDMVVAPCKAMAEDLETLSDTVIVQFFQLCIRRATG